jgi:hypothetical protein
MSKLIHEFIDDWLKLFGIANSKQFSPFIMVDRLTIARLLAVIRECGKGQIPGIQKSLATRYVFVFQLLQTFFGIARIVRAAGYVTALSIPVIVLKPGYVFSSLAALSPLDGGRVISHSLDLHDVYMQIWGTINPLWGTIEDKAKLSSLDWILMEILLRNLVPPARFQRATFRLGGGRSMQLSYGSRTGEW